MGADFTATVIPRTFGPLPLGARVAARVSSRDTALGVGGQGRLHAAIGANASVHIVVDGSGCTPESFVELVSQLRKGSVGETSPRRGV